MLHADTLAVLLEFSQQREGGESQQDGRKL